MTPRAASIPTLLLLLLADPAQAALGTAADSLFELPRHDTLVGSKDVALAIGASASVAVVTLMDRNVSHEAPESNSPFARSISHGAEKLGNPSYLAPALGALWIAGKLSGHPGVSASTLRIAGGIATSAAVSSGIKVVAGRSRPYETPDDPDEFQAFSGHTAFPSGHTTVAFSLAAGIDQETRARWVPYVVYPLAGLVGWSRLRDNRHWASDVLAGALVGVWSTHKFRALVHADERRPAFSLDFAPGAAAATYRF